MSSTSNLLWQYLLSGNFLGLVIAVYTLKMGEYFYGFVFFLMSVPLYIRTQSLTYVVMLWLICSGLVIYFMPLEAQKLVGLFMVLATGGIFYMIISKIRR